MVATTCRLTYADLADLPDDGKRYELIDGDLYVTPAPFTAHQLVSMRFSSDIFLWTTRRDLGQVLTAPCDVRFDDGTVVEPDILFVSRARLGIVGPACVEGVPDLVAEIISPSSRQVDEGRKLALYEEWGVREYWLLDYERRDVRVLALDAAGAYEAAPVVDGIARSLILPGFTIEVAALFAGLR